MSTSRTERLGLYDWVVFGRHRDIPYMVGIVAGPNEDLGYAPSPYADMLVEEHNKVLRVLEDALDRLELLRTQARGE
jgi:hypothetical protein